MRLFLTIGLVLLSLCSFTQITLKDTIYINNGTYTAVGDTTFPMWTFNGSNEFIPQNEKFHLNPGDSLALTIINNDSINHGFVIQGGISAVTLSPGETEVYGTKFNEKGVFIFYDPLNYPNNKAMGLAGMIIVDNHPESLSFNWNIKAFRNDWNEQIVNGNYPNWSNYYPNYFTINGNSNPNINLDTNARVTGQVGDTIRIYIANTGQAIHSLHFHGYHLKIVYSSKNENHIGREKDTFPIYNMETLILELVPDKVGEYPVHDHNLVAVTGGNLYPNGMFVTLLIE